MGVLYLKQLFYFFPKLKVKKIKIIAGCCKSMSACVPKMKSQELSLKMVGATLVIQLVVRLDQPLLHIQVWKIFPMNAKIMSRINSTRVKQVRNCKAHTCTQP